MVNVWTGLFWEFRLIETGYLHEFIKVRERADAFECIKIETNTLNMMIGLLIFMTTPRFAEEATCFLRKPSKDVQEVHGQGRDPFFLKFSVHRLRVIGKESFNSD